MLSHNEMSYPRNSRSSQRRESLSFGTTFPKVEKYFLNYESRGPSFDLTEDQKKEKPPSVTT